MISSSGLRVVVLGLGVQGLKRRCHAGYDYVASVDPVNPVADYRDVANVPLADYDAALCCIPDGPKIDVLNYLIENGKHALVEKPLWAAADEDLVRLDRAAKARDVYVYTAYNHRFEPHFERMRQILHDGRLGRIYSCRMFYGNGTSRLVRDSVWRDHGSGVLLDLGSHLLDTAAFWFKGALNGIRVISAHSFENRAPDHVVLGQDQGIPRLEFEMTLMSWRNHFTCDVLAEHGSAHIESLCKWGPSSLSVRTRVLPSGRPPEERVILIQEDPTWALEYADFRSACLSGRRTDLSQDIALNGVLRDLGKDAVAMARVGHP